LISSISQDSKEEETIKSLKNVGLKVLK